MFLFFEMSFDLLGEVSAVFRIVSSTGVSCTYFRFFVSSCGSLIFCSYLSLFLVFKFDHFLDELVRCLLYLFVGFIERSFFNMFGLLFWLVLLVLLSSLVIDWLRLINCTLKISFRYLEWIVCGTKPYQIIITFKSYRIISAFTECLQKNTSNPLN